MAAQKRKFNDRQALIALNMAGDIGAVRLERLLKVFGTPQNVFDGSVSVVAKVAGITEEQASKIRNFDPRALEKELELARRRGLRVITIWDAFYPERLKSIPDAPIVLYVRGTLLGDDAVSVAVVGSRRASFYGLSCAEKFAADLSEIGFTVVSGMARGIDTAAHRGALRRKGRTIAVLGSGLGQIYPPENIKLAEKIAASGAVVSEFPVFMPPFRHNFPRRNRIISGLSMAVIVVEAAERSGALITADFALEQGRDVFAVPGKVDTHTAQGTNALIKQGARLVSRIEDIVEELSIPLLQQKNRQFSLQQATAGDFSPLRKKPGL